MKKKLVSVLLAGVMTVGDVYKRQYVSHNHMADYRLLLSLILQSHIREVSCTLSEVPVPLLCESHHLHPVSYTHLIFGFSCTFSFGAATSCQHSHCHDACH